MTHFKIGDRVKCMDARDSGANLEMGRDYEIVSIEDRYLIVKDDDGFIVGGGASRFKHCAAPEADITSRIRGVLAQSTDPQRTVEIIARLVGMRVEQQRVVFVKGDA
jgi:hypothetical protein